MFEVNSFDQLHLNRRVVRREAIALGAGDACITSRPDFDKPVDQQFCNI